MSGDETLKDTTRFKTFLLNPTGVSLLLRPTHHFEYAGEWEKLYLEKIDIDKIYNLTEVVKTDLPSRGSCCCLLNLREEITLEK